MDCSNTKTCMNEWVRMCKTVRFCYECEFKGFCCQSMKENPEKSIAIIQKWSDEHPQEIDWNKVPVDTPVFVKDYDKEDWRKRYFITYLPNGNGSNFCVFVGGYKKNAATDTRLYKQCKLAPEVDPTPFLKDGE